MSLPGRVLLLEINELHLEVLREAAHSLQLKSLQTLLKFRLTHTTTDDRYESGFLEPWVQWVSIHTGTPSTRHQVKHLGDVPNLGFSQIWEDAGERGFSTGIFGVMNGNVRETRNCRFFLPDPWTFSEQGKPAELAQLLVLPRYIARDYLKLSTSKVLSLLPGFLSAIWKAGALVPAIKTLGALVPRMARFGFKPFVFISSFDELFVDLFLRYDRKYRPDVSILFLNGLAHLQHHQWTERLPAISAPMQFGLRLLDRMVGKLLADRDPKDVLCVLNGLSQKNSYFEETWVLYRQKSPKNFLRDLGVKTSKVEPLMTHDAHLFFESDFEAERAFRVLSAARIEGAPLFHVERDAFNSRKLFYRVDFFAKVGDNASFELDGKTHRFFEHFQRVVTRSGSHIPAGFLLTKGLDLGERMHNHEIKDALLLAMGRARNEEAATPSAEAAKGHDSSP